jgi:UDP-N-acetyl-D-galactosamine dehydrogenase
MIKKDIKVKSANILVLGFTFKEDCPDVRNTKVIDIITELNTYGMNISIVDPWANPEEVKHEYGIETTKEIPTNKKFDAVVLAVGHKEFLKLNVTDYLNTNNVIYDVKGLLDKSLIDARL